MIFVELTFFYNFTNYYFTIALRSGTYQPDGDRQIVNS